MELFPVPLEVPLTVIEPELVVMDPRASIPSTVVDPLAALPVIVTLPAPLTEMLEYRVIKTPMELIPVPHEVPLTMIEPELVTMDPFAMMPEDEEPPEPFPLMPVIVTHPDPAASKVDDVRFTPAVTESNAPRPSIVIFPPVVFTFTPAPLIQTPSNAPV